MSSWQVGVEVTITGTFRNPAGTPTDPTTAVLTVVAPDGTTTTPSLTHTNGTGIYTAAVALDQDGAWAYRWAGTGAVKTADEGTIYVQRSRVL